MSFSCPHYDFATERCLRLDVVCVPGRPGCVLCGKVAFIDEAKDRIARREARHRPGADSDGLPPMPSGL